MRRIILLVAIAFVFCVKLIAQIPTTNLKLWLKSDSVENISSKVATWYDISGNNFNLTQAVIGKRPLLQTDAINGYPTVKFDGSDDYLKTLFGSSFTQPNTIFCVFKMSAGGFSYIFDGGQSFQSLRYWNTSLELRVGGDILSYSRPTPNNFIVVTSEFNTTNSRIYENGALEKTGPLPSGGIDGLTLGSYYDGIAAFLNGEIAEVILYNCILSTEDRVLVESYLMDKYSGKLELGPDLIIDYGYCDTILKVSPEFNSVLWSTGATGDTVYIVESGQYWVQGTDAFGRVQSDTINVQFPNPNLQNTNICLGDSVLYESELVGSYDYLWSDSGTESSKYLKDAGDYWLRMEDSFGCFDTAFFSIEVDSFKNNISLGNDTSLCSGNTIRLIDGEELCSTFLWSSNGNTNPIQTVTETGWQKIEVENANGCVASDSIYVTIVGTAPTPGYFVENLCFGDTTQFIDNSTPQADIASWQWIINDNDTLLSQNAGWVFENIGTQNIVLVVEAFSGCSNSTSFDIEILPESNVSFTNQPICTGLNVNFESVVSVPDGTSILDFAWEIDGFSVSTEETLSYIFNSPGDYNISLSIALDNSCLSVYDSIVNVSDNYPLPEFLSLITPPSNFIVSATPIGLNFSWNNSSNTSFYELTISENQNFNENYFQSTALTSNEFNYNILMPFDTLFWKVTAYNYCLDNVSSETYTLTFFNPNELPMLKLWAHADSAYTTGTFVDTLYDLSTSGFHLTQLNSLNKPTIISNALNEHNIISFDGINDFLKTSFDTVFQQPNTIFLITKVNNNNCYLYDGASLFQSLRYWSNSYQLRVEGSIIGFDTISNDFNLITSIYNVANSQIIFNSNTINSGALPIGGIDGITLGSYYQAISNFLNGDIAEIIFYDTVLSDSDRQMVERYLHDKYFPPVNLGYDIRVPYGFCDTAITTAYKPWFTSYEWSTGETDSIIHVNRPGVYSVTVTDIFGFESSDDIRVFYPDVNDFADTVVCFGNSVVWDAELVGDYSFAWYGSSETTRAITIDAEGDYAVIVNDTLGCQYLSDTISFSFDNYEFTASVGPADTSLCAGNRLMLVTNRPETVSYLWNTGSTSPEIVLASSGTYSVTTTNWRGCEANDEIDVTITGTVPVPLFSSEGHCAQNPVYFTDLSTSSDGTINSWTWSINGEIFSTEQNPVLSPGDIPDVTAIIPAGEITTNLLRKLNDTARLYRVVPTVNGRETESSGNIPSPPQHNETESSGNIPSPQHNETESNQTKSPTNYQVQLTISTDAGCSDFLTSQLTIYPLPVISFTPDYFCQWAPVDFISTAQVYGGTISENIWDFNGTQQIGENITHTFTQSGNNPITLISTSDVGCRDSLVTEVYVKNASLPVFSTENACEGSEIYFVNNTEVLAHNLPLEWNWDFGDGNTGSGSDPAHIYESAGVYDVSINVVWQNMCEVPAIAQVEVYHNPSLSLLAEDQCINVPFHITKTEESLSGEIISHYWVFGSENPIVSTHPTPQFNSSVPGEYPVSLNIETEFGCVANAVDTVIVHGNPHASFTPSRVWGAVPMEVEFTNNSSDAIGYMWRLDEISVSFDENPVHVYTTEGEFEVKMYAYSQFACEDDTVIIIKSVIPILDVILYDLRTVMSGNYLQTNVYLINNGTLPVNNAEITLDLGDGKIFRENIEYLAPSQVLDYKFNMEVYRADGKVPEVVCTEIYAPPFEGYAETTTDDNVLCSTDVETLRVYQPYPNPATGELNVSFILESESDVTITLISGIGEQVYKNSMSDKTGYQKHIINVGDYTPGVYYLQITAGDEVRSFKVEVL